MQVSVGQSDGAAGGIADGAQHLGALLDAMLEAGVSADGGATKELGSVMTLAVLSDGELTPVRHSKRNADVADVDSLEKAEKRVAIKNLEENEGNAKINSFCSFSNIRIEQNLKGVGISLGDNENLTLGSVTLIKEVEKERMKPSNLLITHDNETDSEEDVIDLSRLCGDLTEEVMDDNSAGLDGVLVDVPIKVAKSKKKKKLLNKKVAAKKNYSNERCVLEL